jgi:hypothetical protein
MFKTFSGERRGVWYTRSSAGNPVNNINVTKGEGCIYTEGFRV